MKLIPEFSPDQVGQRPFVTTYGLSPLLSTPSSGTVVISTLKIQLTVIYCPLVVVDIGGHYHMLEIALSKPVSNYDHLRSST
jgi:hypothetical protein